jgi:hypothetical protein
MRKLVLVTLVTSLPTLLASSVPAAAITVGEARAECMRMYGGPRGRDDPNRGTKVQACVKKAMAGNKAKKK